ncbi:MAG TPA: dienelactone hydrolase family protein [Candidatus Sulfotelmatobacter sp.]|nr:dienelactone hydrolase family protein [Candidatus Sulfotelmatobacter sp.]
MDDARSRLAPADLTRRGFFVTSIGAGFAAAVQPVCAETMIMTDTDGLTAGMVEVPAADRGIPAYRAMPAKGHGHPTVLVVQEVFGLHEHIKDICRRLAKDGYCAVAPDLYVRQGSTLQMTDLKEILAFVGKVPDAQVLGDLDASLRWAGKNGGDASKAVITGFCWGGRIVWLYAAHNPKLKAGVAWYGPIARPADPLHPKHPIDIASSLKVPVLGLYGGQDASIPLDTIEQMRKAVPANCDIVIYPNAPHGFNADYRPSYRADAALDGWRRMLTWFKTHGAAAIA